MVDILSPAPFPERPKDYVLENSWVQWVAENRLRDCAPESMVETMVAAGLDRRNCTIAVAAIEKDPVFVAARRHQQLLRKLESVVANLQKLWELDPAYTVVEKRAAIPLDEFLGGYVCGCRPVVITDLARDWPALQRWTPQLLKERFGHLDVEIQADRNTDPNYEENKLAHRRIARFGAFIDKVLAGGPTNDYYMTANNEVLRRPEFESLLQDIGSLPEYVDAQQMPRACSFWFGPAGTLTPLHHDTLMLFHTQVVGRKRWRFISPLETPRVYNFHGVFSPIDVERPDLGRYPEFAKVKMFEVVVEPGETLFLPLGWWHQVTSLDVSVSLSYTNLTVPNVFKYVDPSIRNW